MGDPIDEIQERVMHAAALARCLGESAGEVSTFERDLMAAIHGLSDLLDGIHLDLDPKVFRQKVLDSEDSDDAEVSHGA
jgi:hypothetical protein